MFGDALLKQHLEESSAVEIQSLVYSEINMNDPDNTLLVGNYRNRSGETIEGTFDPEDADTKYTGYTDADILVDGGYDEDDNPIAFASEQIKQKLYYSLEDCFKTFRPRSGINKARFFDVPGTSYLNAMTPNMMSRPRYYIPGKDDTFKYWSSFRQTSTDGYLGIANVQKVTSAESHDEFFIADAAPFIVYKNSVPVNRIIVKMQTNVGTSAVQDISSPYGGTIPDPLYDAEDSFINRTVPVSWKIQYLSGTTWTTAMEFSTPFVGRDGYVELQLNDGVWQVAGESLDSSTPVLGTFTDNSLEGTEYVSIDGLRIVVDTMTKYNSTFDLIELSGRLACDFTEMVSDYGIKKIAADLGNYGVPIGQLLAATGSMTLEDYDNAFSTDNPDSIIANKLQRNVQFKFYEIIKNVETEESGEVVSYDYYVPMKTMYTDSFPETDEQTRSVTIQLRDMFSYFENLTAPRVFVKDVSLSYAIALVLDSIGFTNYIYLRSDSDSDPIIKDFFIEDNASVAQIIQDLAVSTQTAVFFDEYNNLVFMSKSYMLPALGDRETDEPDAILYGNTDVAGKLPNIISVSSQKKDLYNSGKISYVERYIQKSTRTIREQSLTDIDKTWFYKPAILWEVSPLDATKSLNGETSTQSSYTLSAIPLSSDISADAPEVNSSGSIINNILDLGEAIQWIDRYSGYLLANQEIIKFDAVEYYVQSLGSVWIGSLNEYQKYFAQIPFGGKMYPTGRVRIYTEPYYESDGSTLKVGVVARHGRGQFNTTISSHNAGVSDTHWAKTNVGGVNMKSSLIFNDKILNDVTVTTNKSGSSTKIVKISALDRLKVRKGQTLKIGGVSTKVAVANVSGGFKVTKNVTYSSGTKIKLSGQPVYTSSTYSTAESATGTSFNSKAAATTAQEAIITSKIRNFLSSSYFAEDDPRSTNAINTSTMQASALSVSGPAQSGTADVLNLVSYMYKDLSDEIGDGKSLSGKPNHFGTRLRIMGEQGAEANTQSPSGAYSIGTFKDVVLKGASGGLALFGNKQNTGYYFEIAAFTATNIESYSGDDDNLNNVIFYKVMSESGKSSTEQAIPLTLRAARSNILVDDGLFTGQYREFGEENPTVYDIAFEYTDIVDSNNKVTGRKFYLYLNNSLIGTVVDPEPLKISSSSRVGLFVRGSSRVMFENIYALQNNVSANYYNASETPLNSISVTNKEDVVEESYRRYTVPEPVQAAYIQGISPIGERKSNLWFEEFGTILRGVDYFNVKYDKAYPALIAKIAPTFNRLKGYSVAGFTPNAYGAEFLVFNITDKPVVFSEETGNWLRILGVTFTNQTPKELSLDEYFAETSNLADPAYLGGAAIGDISLTKQNYQRIKNSITKYGKKEFAIDAKYLQTQSQANEMMGWLSKNVTYDRLSVGLEVFGMPHIRLGDIVSISHLDENDNPAVADSSTRFVVYNIDHSRTGDGIKTTLYISEVGD